MSTNTSAIALLRRFVPFVLPWRRLFFLGLVFSMIVAALGLPLPFVTRYIIDHSIPNRSIASLAIAVSILGLVALVRAVMTQRNAVVMARFREQVVMSIQTTLFRHVEHLSMSFHDSQRGGALLSRIMNDTNHVNGLLSDTAVVVLTNCLKLAFGLVALFYLNWKLTIYVLLTVPLSVLAILFFSRRVRSASVRMQEHIGTVFSTIGETLAGMQVVKAFCIEPLRETQLRDALKRQLRSKLDFVKAGVASNTVTGLVTTAGSVIVLFVGARDVITGDFSLGSYFAYNSFVAYLYGPVQSVLGLNTHLQSGVAALGRIFELLDMERDDAGAAAPLGQAPTDGSVEFDGVGFEYPDGRFGIDGVSFHVDAGSSFALVGRSGSGKSTIVKLLLRFHKPKAGSIKLGGIDLNSHALAAVRRQIAFVPQDCYLFHGSIADNIRVGRTNATDQEVSEMMKRLGLFDRFRNMPNGLQTIVGERGVSLSGGERQMVALARAVMRDAPILVLDEATSEVDSETERYIRSALDQIQCDKTLIVIAHRFYTLDRVAQIGFVEDGEIVARGSHTELYQHVSAYQRLYDEQVIDNGESSPATA